MHLLTAPTSRPGRSSLAARISAAWRPCRQALTAGLGLSMLTAASASLAAQAVGVPSDSALVTPAPTGEYIVGSRWLPLVDSSRVDSLAPTAGAPRRILVRLWYPADSAPGTLPMPIWPGGLRTTRALSTGLGLPDSTLDRVALVASHTYADAPLARQGRPFPVIVFSHGYAQGFESQNSAQMEELASHGYVVASIDHPYETAAVVYPDNGPILRGNQAQIRRLSAELDSTTIALLLRAAAATDSVERLAAARDLMARTPIGRASVARWVADTRFVLDRLARLDDRRARKHPWPLAGALDLARLGVMGMSFGGAVAGELCATDPRCTAGLNLDGLQYGTVIDHPIPRPMLFAYSDQPGATGVNDFAYFGTRAPAYRLVVRGSLHLNFSDLSLLAPIVTIPGTLGPVDPARMEAVMNAYIVAFFDRYLKNAPAPLLDRRPSPFAEVDIRSRALGGASR